MLLFILKKDASAGLHAKTSKEPRKWGIRYESLFLGCGWCIEFLSTMLD